MPLPANYRTLTKPERVRLYAALPIAEKVLPTGDRYVFEVLSRTNPARRYRVDLTECGGASRCACKSWETQKWPAIKAGRQLGTSKTCCLHVQLARNVFTTHLLIELAKQEDQPANKPT